MGRDLEAIVAEIKERADIVEVVGGVMTLKKKGKDWWAPCPFHKEKAPSFSVSRAKQFYKCFGCGASGDVIKFYEEFYHVRFYQALKGLGDLCGVQVEGAGRSSAFMAHPKRRNLPSWEPSDPGTPSALWQEKARKFIVWAFENLLSRPDSLAYLAGRGINEGSIVAYGLGWCENGKTGGDIHRPRESWGLETVMNDKGRRKSLWLPRGLVIPCFGRSGEIQKIRIRRADPEGFGIKMKYYFVPGGANRTMVLGRGHPVHVIVESELDAILVAQEAGDLVTVVCMGSSSARPDRGAAQLLKESSHILNALDADNAGAEQRTWWKDHFPECVRWPVPKGKDPGEAFQAGVDLREWVKAGLP